MGGYLPTPRDTSAEDRTGVPGRARRSTTTHCGAEPRRGVAKILHPEVVNPETSNHLPTAARTRAGTRSLKLLAELYSRVDLDCGLSSADHSGQFRAGARGIP